MHEQLREDDAIGLKTYLAGFDLFVENRQEGVHYINDAFWRLMITLDMIPQAPSAESTLLELGANPYFLTLLLQRFRSYRLTLANFFGDGHVPGGRGRQVISNPTYHERYEFTYEHFNVERETFPYPEDTFNVVLFCEILEHLLIDPTATLSEIQRVLKPGGHLLVTTPNVLACQNILKLAVGQNIYDRYSGYGIYGRHNREYTPQELTELLQSCGFDIMTVRVEDIHPHTTLIVRLLKRLRRQWCDNIFILAKASGVINSAYPASLYRSMRAPSGRSL